MTITNKQAELMKSRCEAATDGPWLNNDYYECVQTGTGDLHVVSRYGNVPNDHKKPDAAFIASARTDLPALLAEREAALALLKRVELKLCDECNCRMYPDGGKCVSCAVREFIKEAEGES